VQAQDFADLAQVEAEHWWFDGMREVTDAMLRPQLEPHRLSRWLDAGCGAGFMLNWLRRYGTQSQHGLDFSFDALQHGRAVSAASLTQASVVQLPYASDTFSVITCFDVLQQLRHPADDTRALREFFRLLTPGGLLVVRVAAYRWLWGRHDRHMHTHYRYNLGEVREQLHAVGFEVLRATHALCVLLPIAAALRWAKNALRTQPASEVKPLPAGLRWLAEPFAATLRWEAQMLRAFPRWSFPFGLSIVCIARKAG